MTTTKIKPTALKSVITKRWKATAVEVWPNGLGLDFRAFGSRFEILHDQDLRRLEIVRRNPDDRPTHIYELNDYSSAPTTVEGMLELACLLWLDLRKNFRKI